MVVKELIEARWKALIGAAVALALPVFLALSYDLLKQLLTQETLQQIPPSLQEQLGVVVGSYDAYVWSQWFPKSGAEALALLAAVLGASLIGGEVNKGTIFFLLSKPVSRVRVLLVKYAVSAAILLAVITLGSVALLVTAAVIGRPQPLGGVAISTLLLWLGTLFVLGLALLFSVLYKDVLRPLVFSLLITLALLIPGFFPGWSDWSLTSYWASQAAYLGQEFPTRALLICLVAAALPVLIAIPLFRKQAY